MFAFLLLYIRLIVNSTKEKRKQSTSLTSSEVLGKPIRIKRVNAHAERRELSTSVLYGFV